MYSRGPRNDTKRKSRPITLNNLYFDRELLESAADTILKIVHPGRSDENRTKRDKNRDKIRSHVRSVMKPSKKSQKSSNCHKTEMPSEIPRIMKEEFTAGEVNRNIFERVKKSCKIKNKKNDTSKLDSAACASLSFEVSAQNIRKTGRSNASPSSQPLLKKRVSFVSPPQEYSKRAGYFPSVSGEQRIRKKSSCPIDGIINRSFQTPPRTEAPRRFQKPPPLRNVKRGFVVTDSPGKFNIAIDHMKNEWETINPTRLETKAADSSPLLTSEETNQYVDKDCSSFDLESVLKTPERIEEPYDFLGLAS